MILVIRNLPINVMATLKIIITTRIVVYKQASKRRMKKLLFSFFTPFTAFNPLVMDCIPFPADHTRTTAETIKKKGPCPYICNVTASINASKDVGRIRDRNLLSWSCVMGEYGMIVRNNPILRREQCRV
jgi:hypothetical protein